MFNKKISTSIAILIIVVLAALAGGVFYWQYKTLERSENKQPRLSLAKRIYACREIDKKTIGNYLRKNRCYESAFKATSSYQEGICENIKDEDEKNLCFNGTAVAFSQESFCEEIENKPERKVCFAHVLLSKPNSTQQEAFNACKEIEEGEVKAICYVYLFEEKGYDPAVCEDLDDEKEYCYFGVALSKEKESFCKKSEGNMKFNCYSAMALMKRDLELCKKAYEQDIHGRDMCYIEIAKLEKEERLCKETSSESKQDLCVLRVAEEKKDPKLCKKAGKYKPSCYSSLASDIGNQEICKKIEEKEEKETCYFSVATRKKDEKVCKLIETTEKKQHCYFFVALQEKDKSLCDKAGQYKDRCYENLDKQE